MHALVYPHAIMIIFLALLIVSIPIVIAHFGTFSNPLNEFAASFLVSRWRYTSLVVLFAGDGG
jgi:hypothetical protein